MSRCFPTSCHGTMTQPFPRCRYCFYLVCVILCWNFTNSWRQGISFHRQMDKTHRVRVSLWHQRLIRVSPMKPASYTPFPIFSLSSSSTDTVSNEMEVTPPLSNAQVTTTNHMRPTRIEKASIYLDHRYTVEEARIHWRDHEHLLTIGSSGVKDSHKNSTHDLTNGHNYVKIKIATDKLNATAIAFDVVADERLVDKVHIVEIRPKGFLVARNNPLPVKHRKQDSGPTHRSSNGGSPTNKKPKAANKGHTQKQKSESIKNDAKSIEDKVKARKSVKAVNPPRSGRKPRPGR